MSGPSSQRFSLSVPFGPTRLSYEVCALIVGSFDGDSALTLLQVGEDETNRQEIHYQSRWRWATPQRVYVVNLGAQPGSSLTLVGGDSDVELEPGVAATSRSLSGIEFGQKTAPTGTATALVGSSIPVAQGFGIVLKALSTNGGKVFVGGAGVTGVTGLELSARESVTVFLSNLQSIYVLGSVAGQVVSYLVEKES
jgi:hypothetical protein